MRHAGATRVQIRYVRSREFSRSSLQQFRVRNFSLSLSTADRRFARLRDFELRSCTKESSSALRGCSRLSFRPVEYSYSSRRIISAQGWKIRMENQDGGSPFQQHLVLGAPLILHPVIDRVREGLDVTLQLHVRTQRGAQQLVGRFHDGRDCGNTRATWRTTQLAGGERERELLSSARVRVWYIRGTHLKK